MPVEAPSRIATPLGSTAAHQTSNAKITTVGSSHTAKRLAWPRVSVQSASIMKIVMFTKPASLMRSLVACVPAKQGIGINELGQDTALSSWPVVLQPVIYKVCTELNICKGLGRYQLPLQR